MDCHHASAEKSSGESGARVRVSACKRREESGSQSRAVRLTSCGRFEV